MISIQCFTPLKRLLLCGGYIDSHVICTLNSVSCVTNLEEKNSNLTVPCLSVKCTHHGFWLNQLSRVNPLPTYCTELQAARAHSTTKYTTPFSRFASLDHLASTENFLTLNCYTQFALQHWKGDGRPHPFEKFMLGAVQSLF